MDFLILGAVLALAGIALAVYAWRGWLTEAKRATRAEYALAVRDNDQELAAAVKRAQDLEQQFREFVAMLTEAGVLRPVADALTVSAGDLAWELHTTPSGPPPVEGITPALMQATLERIADLAAAEGPQHARPLARPALVAPGKLSRLQYDRLRDALIEAGWFERATERSTPALTDKGRAMLAAVRDGRLVVR